MSDDKWADDAWKTPEYVCLACGYKVDAATPTPLEPEPRRPQEGDVTVCLECSHIMVFKPDLTVREATQKELDDIAADGDTQKLLQAMALMRQSTAWARRHGS